MSRRTNRAVERHDQKMTVAVQASAGDQTAAGMVSDRAEELGILSGARMMIDLFEVGKNYYVWTTTFPYCGRLAAKGADYIVLMDAACILWEGRTNTLHRTGDAPNIEVELVGRKVIPIDVIGPWDEWPHKLFDSSR